MLYMKEEETTGVIFAIKHSSVIVLLKNKQILAHGTNLNSRWSEERMGLTYFFVVCLRSGYFRLKSSIYVRNVIF